MSTSAASAAGSKGAAAAGQQTLTVATDATYPPFEWTAGKNIMGIDADLIRALGKTLKMQIVLQQESFDSIVPAIQAGKFDAAISGMLDTKAREGAVSFVDYLKTPATFVIGSSVNPNSLKSFSDLCGKSLAVQSGTVGVAQAQAQKKKCGGNLTIRIYPNSAASVLAVSSGRSQATVVSTAVGAYLVAHSKGKLKLAKAVISQGGDQLGIAVPKSNTALAHTLVSGLKTMIANGSYKRILAHWGIVSSGVTAPAINNAVS